LLLSFFHWMNTSLAIHLFDVLPQSSMVHLVVCFLFRCCSDRFSFLWYPRMSRSLISSQESRSSKVASHDLFFPYLFCFLS
jgi:hypothetical protein